MSEKKKEGGVGGMLLTGLGGAGYHCHIDEETGKRTRGFHDMRIKGGKIGERQTSDVLSRCSERNIKTLLCPRRLSNNMVTFLAKYIGRLSIGRCVNHDIGKV